MKCGHVFTKWYPIFKTGKLRCFMTASVRELGWKKTGRRLALLKKQKTLEIGHEICVSI